MIITVKPITIAKRSECTPYLRAKAVARDTTTAECTEGIPQLPSDLSISHDQVLYLIATHLRTTETTNVTAGIKIII